MRGNQKKPGTKDVDRTFRKKGCFCFSGKS